MPYTSSRLAPSRARALFLAVAVASCAPGLADPALAQSTPLSVATWDAGAAELSPTVAGADVLSVWLADSVALAEFQSAAPALERAGAPPALPGAALLYRSDRLELLGSSPLPNASGVTYARFRDRRGGTAFTALGIRLGDASVLARRTGLERAVAVADSLAEAGTTVVLLGDFAASARAASLQPLYYRYYGARTLAPRSAVREATADATQAADVFLRRGSPAEVETYAVGEDGQVAVGLTLDPAAVRASAKALQESRANTLRQTPRTQLRYGRDFRDAGTLGFGLGWTRVGEGLGGLWSFGPNFTARLKPGLAVGAGFGFAPGQELGSRNRAGSGFRPYGSFQTEAATTVSVFARAYAGGGPVEFVFDVGPAVTFSGAESYFGGALAPGLSLSGRAARTLISLGGLAVTRTPGGGRFGLEPETTLDAVFAPSVTFDFFLGRRAIDRDAAEPRNSRWRTIRRGAGGRR